MIPGRRTHGVYQTEDDAMQAAVELALLMNGVPFGYVFCVQKKMGAFAFISLPREAFAK